MTSVFNDEAPLLLLPSASNANFSESTPSSGVYTLDKERLTARERLAAECLKPRYRSPCQPFQKLKCVRRRGGENGEPAWRLKKCKASKRRQILFDGQEGVAAAQRQNERSPCRCRPGAAFGWRPQLGTPESSLATELRAQRAFLRRHTADGRKHRFLKSLKGGLLGGARGRKWNRLRRDLNGTHLVEEEEEGEEVERGAQGVLDVIAEEEIDEIGLVMEDISDEIEDLERSMNGSAPSSHRPPDLKCRVLDDDVSKVNCSSEIYSSRSDWRHSRTVINEQIRRLRAQLFELKEIRKHLKEKRPKLGEEEKVDEEEEASLTEADKPEVPANAIQCACPGALQASRRAARISRRERVRQQRLRRRIRRRERRRLRRERLKKLKRRAGRRKACAAADNNSSAVTAGADENLNCFSHDNNHWKTAPFWTGKSPSQPRDCGVCVLRRFLFWRVYVSHGSSLGIRKWGKVESQSERESSK